MYYMGLMKERVSIFFYAFSTPMLFGLVIRTYFSRIYANVDKTGIVDYVHESS